ncbi:PREDICTED: uncharacterized protein LOC109244049 [Nicotiana attenuata]|uniref:uncharacterized protein LOC109244049 n=1 Tax=Nicotiana attenuata TaxID=49451 RepID=UPI000904C8D2|nr:PREDICTED: uncharacterized protein LOC109244049 [Nicotiana attenuata]
MNYVNNFGGQRQGGHQWRPAPNKQYRPNMPQPGGMQPQGQMVSYQRQQGYPQQNQEKLAYQPPPQQQDGNMVEIRGMLQQLIRTNGDQLMEVSLRNGRDLDREQEVAQSRRETKPVAPAPLEIDESAELIEVVVKQVQDDKGKAKESEQDAEQVVPLVPQNPNKEKPARPVHSNSDTDMQCSSDKTHGSKDV